jgi:hypothetical protein
MKISPLYGQSQLIFLMMVLGTNRTACWIRGFPAGVYYYYILPKLVTVVVGGVDMCKAKGTA